MTTLFSAYFALLRDDARHALASKIEADLKPAVLTALLQAGLLARGPAATHYPCINVGGACPRRVIEYRGPRPDLYCARAVPPDQHFCCSPENLTRDQLRTYVADGHRLTARLTSWVGADHAVDSAADRDDPIVRIGYLQSHGAHVRVFLARRATTRLARARLLDLETTGPALVLALMRDDGVSAEFEERYGGRSNVRVLFLEDYLRMNGDTLELAPIHMAVGEEAPRAPASTNLPPLRLLSHLGEVPITPQAAEVLRARTDLQLFVDLTVSARGGGAAGYALVEAPDGGPMRRDFVLSTAQALTLQEYVRAAGRPIAPQRLACVRAAGIRDATRMVRALLARVDLSLGRDRHRAFQSHKDLTGRVSEYSFAPPAGFEMALLLPASR